MNDTTVTMTTTTTTLLLTTTTTTTTSTNRLGFSSLPNVIFHLFTNDYLTDREAISTARTEHTLHRIISSGYRIKNCITYYVCIDTNTNLRFIQDTRPRRRRTQSHHGIQQNAHRIAIEVAGSTTQPSQFELEAIAEKMVQKNKYELESLSCLSARKSTQFVVLSTAELQKQQQQQWSIGIRTRIRINTFFANSPYPPLDALDVKAVEDSNEDEDEDQQEEEEDGDGDGDGDEMLLDVPQQISVVVSAYEAPSPFHSLTDWTFLPPQIRELIIECRTIDSVRMPSLAEFRHLDSITFAHTTNYNFPFLSNQTLWPSQLRSLKYQDDSSYVGYASEEESDGEDEFFGYSEEESAQRKVTQRERMKPLFARPDHRIFFPPTLTSFILPQFPAWIKSHNRDMRMVEWPSGLTRLRMRCQYHPFTEPNFTLPDSVTELELGEYSKYSLAGWIPPRSLRMLLIGRHTYQNAPELISWSAGSEGLTHLSLNERFHVNQAQEEEKENSIVPPLRPFSLSLAHRYPSSLTHLDFHVHSSFFGNHSHELVFPPALRTLICRQRLTGSFVGVTFSPSLTRLEFHDWVPPNEPFVSDVFTRLTQLESLHLGWDRKVRATVISSLKLPISLRSLSFGDNFSSRIDMLQLNEGLTSLRFGARFKLGFSANKLPASLRVLEFDRENGRFSSPLGLEKTQLSVLKLFAQWNHEPASSDRKFKLPPSLGVLHFGARFNSLLSGYQFPSSLRELSLGERFSQSMQGVILPSELEILEFGYNERSSFSEVDSLQDLTFPSSLTRLSLPHPDSLRAGDIVVSPFYDQLVVKLRDQIGELRLIEYRYHA